MTDKPKVALSISVHHNLTEREQASIHIGHCAVCRGDDLEVFTGKDGDGICVNAGACFRRYCALPEEVVKDD